MNKHFVAVVATIFTIAATCFSQPITPPTPRSAYGQRIMLATNNVDALSILGIANSNGVGYTFQSGQFEVSAGSNVTLAAWLANANTNAAFTNALNAGKFLQGIAQGTNIVLVTNGSVITVHSTATGSGTGNADTNAIAVLNWPGFTSFEWLTFVDPSTGDFNFDNQNAARNVKIGISDTIATGLLTTSDQVTSIVNAIGGSSGTDIAYYVAPYGNDGTATRGNRSLPWLTLSNAIQSCNNSNATIVILPGIYTNYHVGHQSGTNSAVSIPILAKTNLTIIGEGNPELYWPTQVGGFFFRNCSNVLMKGFTISHARPYVWSNYPPAYVSNLVDVDANHNVFGMIEIENGNQFLTFKDLKLIGGYDHGILGHVNATSTNSVIVDSCSFYNGGNLWTNAAAGRFQRDGAAIVPLNGWVVRDNTINGWGRGIEPYPNLLANDPTNRQTFPMVQVLNNTIVNTLDFAIDCERVSAVIIGNTCDANVSTVDGNASGILLRGVDGIIMGNRVRNYDSGILLESVTDLTIVGNTIENANYCINVGEYNTTYPNRRVIIQGNWFGPAEQQGIRFAYKGYEFTVEGNIFKDCGTNRAGNDAPIYLSNVSTVSNLYVFNNQFVNLFDAGSGLYAVKTNAGSSAVYNVWLNGNRALAYAGGLHNLTTPLISDLALPGNNAASNYVWTCTNAITGQGEWRQNLASTNPVVFHPGTLLVTNSITAATQIVNTLLVTNASLVDGLLTVHSAGTTNFQLSFGRSYTIYATNNFDISNWTGDSDRVSAYTEIMVIPIGGNRTVGLPAFNVATNGGYWSTNITSPCLTVATQNYVFLYSAKAQGTNRVMTTTTWK